MSFTVPAPLISETRRRAPDLYAAVYRFVRQYAVPFIAPENIYRGWQNYSALPPASNEFAIISIVSQQRRGTTVEGYRAEDADADGTLTLLELVICRVQIDCYSDGDDAARHRAQALETIARSTVGPLFFKQYGIGCHFASDLRLMAEPDGSKQYVKRGTVELNLSYWTEIELSLPWFDTAGVYLENVDVHHRPTNKE